MKSEESVTWGVSSRAVFTDAWMPSTVDLLAVPTAAAFSAVAPSLPEWFSKLAALSSKTWRKKIKTSRKCISIQYTPGSLRKDIFHLILQLLKNLRWHPVLLLNNSQMPNLDIYRFPQRLSLKHHGHTQRHFPESSFKLTYHGQAGHTQNYTICNKFTE